MNLKFFYLRDTIIPTIANIAIAFGIAFGQTSGGTHGAPFETTSGAMIEFIPGTFMPAFLIALVGTFLTRKAIRSGVIPPKSGSVAIPRHNCLVRSLGIGLITTLVMVPIAGFLAHAYFPDMTARSSIILLMCVDATILGLIVAPLTITLERLTHQTIELAAQASS
ncbi:hypothetical protein [uncultured Cohaesibacter sp.]|uniref:hypothetical protein n=1 Tax=uncultured Cohaesibacter sp. TaxID=1002546 RepID=UPI00292EE9AF|nr:hypothetical protein [uncultured Cohaesibacter sp.]